MIPFSSAILQTPNLMYNLKKYSIIPEQLLKYGQHSVLLRWSVDGVFATTLHRINAFIFSEILGRDGIMESFRLIMDFLEVNTSTIWRIQHLIFSFI